MHDEAPAAEVARFFEKAASAFPGEPPAPGPALAALFADGLPAVAQPEPRPTRRSPMRSALSTIPGKLAFAAAGLAFATTGLAAANALPGPIQTAAADLGDTIGLELPGLPTDEVPDLPTDEVPDLPTDEVPDLPTDEIPAVPTPPVVDPVLPPAATTASAAAKIHAFDEACGNHGKYVSFVARNGTEPTCATNVRNGTTTPPAPPTDDTDDDTTDGDDTTTATKSGGKPAGAGKAKSGR